jgi:hypothetical protein
LACCTRASPTSIWRSNCRKRSFLEALQHLAAVHAIAILERPRRALAHLGQRLVGLFDLDAVLAFERAHVALDGDDLAQHVAQVLDQRIDLVGMQLEGVDFLLQLLLARLDRFVDDLLLVAVLARADLLLEVDEFVAQRLDVLDLAREARDFLLDRARRRRVADLELQELVDAHLFVLELLHEIAQLDERRIGREHRFQDQVLAALDALGDLDLALAVEERHTAHFAQVHANRVVVLDRGLDRLFALELLLAAILQLHLLASDFFRVVERDVELGQLAVDRIETVEIEVVVDEFVDVIVEDVASVVIAALQLVDDLAQLRVAQRDVPLRLHGALRFHAARVFHPLRSCASRCDSARSRAVSAASPRCSASCRRCRNCVSCASSRAPLSAAT